MPAWLVRPHGVFPTWFAIVPVCTARPRDLQPFNGISTEMVDIRGLSFTRRFGPPAHREAPGLPDDREMSKLRFNDCP